MKIRPSLCNALLLLLFLLTTSLLAQKDAEPFVYGDALPDAPELAQRGTYAVGVRTIDLVHEDQVDVLRSKEGNDPLYDRPLKVEVWYPCLSQSPDASLITYDEVMGTAGDAKRPLIPFQFLGRANRDAAAITGEGAFPLVVVSHGYVGSRYLMTYLTENLASKGYVVAAIDHTESTFRDAAGFQSTLLNRSKDILFVIDEMAKRGASQDENFFGGIVDAEHTAVIGYSMGGYGALNAAGAAYSEFAINFFSGMTGGSKALASRGVGEEYARSLDPRIKAVVAFAPWGMERGVWDSETLKGLTVPTLFVAGSEDDISGYENGIKAIYEGAVNADRYLLTYINARHNVAPNPPPAAALAPGLHIDEYYRYAEPSWDQRRMNNINQHFITAFLGIRLKGLEYEQFLDIAPDSNDATWPGFVPRSSTGMELLSAKAQ